MLSGSIRASPAQSGVTRGAYRSRQSSEITTVARGSAPIKPDARCQTQEVGFIGFEDDVILCVDLFKYAVDCVRSEVKRIKKQYADYGADYIKSRCDSFGYGFATGLRAAFEAQTAEKAQEWGLVLVMPREVQEAADKLGKPTSFRARSQDSIFGNEFAKGYKSGQEFQMQKRIAAEV